MATSLSDVGDGVDRLAHLLEGAAAADVGDRIVDILVARFWLFLEKCCDRHDHATLAVTALRYIVFNPGLLHLVQPAILGEAFNCRDVLAFDEADRHGT